MERPTKTHAATKLPTRAPSSRLVWLALAAIVLLTPGLTACETDPADDCPTEGVSFSDDILPINEFHCAECHRNGQDGIKLAGTASDYDAMSPYLTAYSSAESVYLDWATGQKGRHEATWTKGDAAYRCVATWIDEGAEP